MDYASTLAEALRKFEAIPARSAQFNTTLGEAEPVSSAKGRPGSSWEKLAGGHAQPLGPRLTPEAAPGSVAAHESSRTTKLYDRAALRAVAQSAGRDAMRAEAITEGLSLDEIERILI